jgi:N-acetylmuramic acid 6-phosphate (MurNAc-6-P) etherase
MALHRMSVAECVDLLVREDATSLPAAMEAARPALVGFIEAVQGSFRGEGRLVYLGAGESGAL